MDQLLCPDNIKQRAHSSASDDSAYSSNSSLRSSCNSKTPPLTFTHIMGQGRVNQLGGVFINGRPLPHHIRLKIIELASKGIKPCHISRQLKVSHGCVSKILYRYAETGTVVPGQIGGASKQSRKFVENLEQKAIEIHNKNPDLPAAQIRSLLMSEGFCDRTNAPSTHSIAKLIKGQQNVKKTQLKHSISGILGKNNDDNDNQISHNKSISNNGNNRRCRTWFSPEQLDCLERAFNANTYPSAEQREEISARTGLDEAKIQVWFSNRRARYRKTVTSASLEHWTSAIRATKFGMQLTSQNSPSSGVEAESPSDSSDSAQEKMEVDESAESPQHNPIFPFFPHPNPAQLLTTLILFARPDYLQMLQEKKNND